MQSGRRRFVTDAQLGSCGVAPPEVDRLPRSRPVRGYVASSEAQPHSSDVMSTIANQRRPSPHLVRRRSRSRFSTIFGGVLRRENESGADG